VSKAELKTYEWTGGISQQAVDRWAQGYIDCMTAKGYRVTRWEPKGYR
jgi:hypothetical protein